MRRASAAYYFIDFSGRGLFRGDTLWDAELLLSGDVEN